MNCCEMPLALALGLFLLGAAQAGPNEDALNHPDRTDADRQRDENSKPAELMAFMGVAPGMTVLDIFAGGGYWSEILSYAVGENGRVYAHTNAAYQGWTGAQYDERFAEGRLPNVVRHHAELDDLELEDDSIDLAIIVMGYHDVYYTDQTWPPVDADGFLLQIHDAIRPGGALVVVDHAAPAGTGSSAAQDFHRIDPDFARRDFERFGFQFAGSSDVLANPQDDRSKSSFDPSVRGQTDKFSFRFIKPED